MQSHISRRRATTALGVTSALALSLALSACGTVGDGSTGEGEGDDGVIRIAYIQKQGDQQYFIDQADGAREAAAALGAEVTVINVGDDANEAISQIQTVISQGYDAIAIVVPDQQIGPQVIELAAEAGIPLVATDDAISDADGNPAPFVGFDGRAMGEAVGTEAARLFAETDWSLENTRFLSVSKQDLQTCEDRVNGAYDLFVAESGVSLERVVVGSDASSVDSQDQATAAITGNQGVENWVVVGCNDESATGAVTALQNAAFGPDNIIGVGLGAYLMCKDWKAGVESGNRAALFISGVDVGKAAIEVLVDAVANGVELPANTIADTKIVTPDNWESEGVICT